MLLDCSFFVSFLSYVFVYCCFFFFFFSSRRRHTRCLSDWSSDVCSSDLGGSFGVHVGLPVRRPDEQVEAGIDQRAAQRVAYRCGRGRLHVADNQIGEDRKSTRLNSSHLGISYAVFCLKKKSTRPEYVAWY